jgi:hypothetical protein
VVDAHAGWCSAVSVLKRVLVLPTATKIKPKRPYKLSHGVATFPTTTACTRHHNCVRLTCAVSPAPPGGLVQIDGFVQIGSAPQPIEPFQGRLNSAGRRTFAFAVQPQYHKKLLTLRCSFAGDARLTWDTSRYIKVRAK